ncbi:hypothetical protein AKJ65_06600 [candidate division MSBL1 archaeon SCGC-AAA259E19]|uniref:Uncharacterized protein n=1 Tax=candidate division MSBL1 archaeon SCGC-AAA259E19 TaxID=1698264 RepID=A0A133UFZ7_9EURY|nr:hypothetical protein AKJ65_06600 [candidate division MSBL1 archaeon SCGC-AAA259E19]
MTSPEAAHLKKEDLPIIYEEDRLKETIFFPDCMHDLKELPHDPHPHPPKDRPPGRQPACNQADLRKVCRQIIQPASSLRETEGDDR